MQTFFVSSVATTETLEGSYRANDGNGVLDDLGRKSPRRTQFPLTDDPSGLTSPGREGTHARTGLFGRRYSRLSNA